jgi:Flp pilus assembly protein TadG
VRAFLAGRSGVSLVEFALIAPLLVLVFVGSIDTSRAVTAANRASYVADMIGELVSQATGTLSDETIHGFIRSAPLINADILRYGRQIGSTDLPALVNVSVSSVAFAKANAACTANCTYLAATVFSRALSGPARPCGPLLSVPDTAATTPLTLPASTFGPVSLVVVDVEVFFKPLFAGVLPIPIKFRRSAYFRPRLVARINAATNCSGY